jgi:hypothetical protein
MCAFGPNYTEFFRNEGCIHRSPLGESKMRVTTDVVESVGDSRVGAKTNCFSSLCLQVHFLEKFGVSRVLAKILQQRIRLDVGYEQRDPGLLALQPFK